MILAHCAGADAEAREVLGGSIAEAHQVPGPRGESEGTGAEPRVTMGGGGIKRRGRRHRKGKSELKRSCDAAGAAGGLWGHGTPKTGNYRGFGPPGIAETGPHT